MDELKERHQDDQYGHRADDGVKLTTAFGTIQAHGPMVVIVILLVCAVAVFAVMVREHDLKQTEHLSAAVASRDVQLKQMDERQGKLQESMDVMVFILAMSPEDRAKLRLDMPASLRTRLLNSERNR